LLPVALLSELSCEACMLQAGTTSLTCVFQDCIIYVASGNGVLLTSPDDDGLEPKRHELSKGDFAFVPAWTEHQARNSSEEEDLVWVVTRAGSSPVEVTLTDWSGAEVKGTDQ
jgi:uncharacterized RmlC-like cupin family protein